MTHFFSMVVLGAALIVGAAPGLTTTAQADFTGTWVLDASQNEGLPEGIEQTMTVNQSGDRIEIETHSKGPMGEQRMPDVYVLDGNETDFQPPVPSNVSATGRRTSRWSEGRNGFETSEHFTMQGPEGQEATVTGTRKWTLAPDGETLTIEMTMNGPQGEMTSRRVFTRQSPAAE